MRISDGRSDVCSSDLAGVDAMLDVERRIVIAAQVAPRGQRVAPHVARRRVTTPFKIAEDLLVRRHDGRKSSELGRHVAQRQSRLDRSEEHTSELQSLMRISYAVFCLKKKKTNNTINSQPR